MCSDQIMSERSEKIGTQYQSLPDLEQITTLSPAFRNSLDREYPIPVSNIRNEHKDNKIYVAIHVNNTNTI